MSDGTPSVTCGNAECQLATTGACIDGHQDPASCPFFEQDVSPSVSSPSHEEAAETPTPDELQPSSSLVSVARGEALNLRESAILFSKRPARVISVVGPVEAGKTSLIASVYDLFQTAPPTDLSFAESRSLLGYERICHLARASSEAPNVGGERTDHDPDPFFYHLAIMDSEVGRRDLLFADRSGELYESIPDQPTRAMDMIELVQCGVLTVLIDGAGLCAPMRRHRVLSEARQFLSSVFDCGAIPKDADLVIVLSKLDIVEASDDTEDVKSVFLTFAEETREAFLHRVANIHIREIAASPTVAGTPKGFGVDDLLRLWLSVDPPCESIEATVQPFASSRAMGRFGMHRSAP